MAVEEPYARAARDLESGRKPAEVLGALTASGVPPPVAKEAVTRAATPRSRLIAAIQLQHGQGGAAIVQMLTDAGVPADAARRAVDEAERGRRSRMRAPTKTESGGFGFGIILIIWGLSQMNQIGLDSNLQTTSTFQFSPNWQFVVGCIVIAVPVLEFAGEVLFRLWKAGGSASRPPGA